MMKIINLRSIKNVKAVAKYFNNSEAREAGIYINEKELRYYQASPWIEAFVLLKDEGFAGFASFNLSEKVWGRGQWQEFYLSPRHRNQFLGYRFYKEMLKIFKGYQGVRAYVRTTNKAMFDVLRRLGWKEECVIRKYDSVGRSYYQMSLGRGKE
jgi:ribosomal protein S18 acetylase RimI-like enzyme